MSSLWPRVRLFIGSFSFYIIASNSGLLSSRRQHSISYCLLMWLELNDSHGWPQKHDPRAALNSEHLHFVLMQTHVDLVLFFLPTPVARRRKSRFPNLKLGSASTDLEKHKAPPAAEPFANEMFCNDDSVCQSSPDLFSLWNAIALWDAALSLHHLGTSRERTNSMSPCCLTTVLPTGLSAGCRDRAGKTRETKHRRSSDTHEGTADEGGRNGSVSLQRR